MFICCLRVKFNQEIKANLIFSNYQVIPDHGIAKRSRHCLKAIYLNLSELNINFLIKHLRSIAGKLIEIKKPPKTFSKAPKGHKTSTDSSVRHCFQQRTYWLEWYLVIPGNRLTVPNKFFGL